MEEHSESLERSFIFISFCFFNFRLAGPILVVTVRNEQKLNLTFS